MEAHSVWPSMYSPAGALCELVSAQDPNINWRTWQCSSLMGPVFNCHWFLIQGVRLKCCWSRGEQQIQHLRLVFESSASPGPAGQLVALLWVLITWWSIDCQSNWAVTKTNCSLAVLHWVCSLQCLVNDVHSCLMFAKFEIQKRKARLIFILGLLRKSNTMSLHWCVQIFN